MTKNEAIDSLARCFAALPKRDRERLAWHEEQGTPICCRFDHQLFLNGKGAG